MEIFKGFLPYTGLEAYLVNRQKKFEQTLVPLSKNAKYEIQFQLTNWLQSRCLKILTDEGQRQPTDKGQSIP